MRIKSFGFLLVLGIAFAGCGDNNNEPLGVDSGSTLTKGADGPNVVVTEQNGGTVRELMTGVVLKAFDKALAALASGTQLAATARITGDRSGYAQVDGSSTTGETAVNYDFTLKFYDYSDNGSLFIGSSLSYKGDVSVIAGKVYTKTTLNGEVKFAGPYSGSIKYSEFISQNGESTSSVVFTSGGKTFTYNPEVPWGPQ
ncbi:MAG TPA: hypothetical protein VM123_14115 [archaeon]|nr:hypothetical protein [archaeon]